MKLEFGDKVIVQNRRYPNGVEAVVLENDRLGIGVLVWVQGGMISERVHSHEIIPKTGMVEWLFTGDNFARFVEFAKCYDVNETNYEEALNFFRKVQKGVGVIEARIVKGGE